jgi:hypothetical protein
MASPTYNDAITAVANHLRSGHALSEVLGDLERTLEQGDGDEQLVAKVRAAHRERRPANTSMAGDQQITDLPPTAE